MTREEMGAALRTQREKRGLTQEDLAFRMDTSPSLISRIENGRENFTIATLLRMLEELDVACRLIAH